MKKIIAMICLLLVSLLIFSSNIVVFAEESNNIGLNLNSKSYILFHPESNKTLVAVNENQKTPVASICKLMTTLLVLEELENQTITLDQEFIASEYACSVEGSQAFLDVNSKYSVRDLLKSVVVASANDSAVVLAEGVCGTETMFVQRMNEKAEELGMVNTLYENATGLFTTGQYSTAKDTLKILKEVSKYELYNEFCHIWMDKLVHPSGRETELVNTNRLVRYYDYCLNGKTGYVDESGYCLASSAMKDGMKLMAVVLGGEKASDRFEDSVDLYSYGFANYYNKQVVFENQELDKQIKISKSKTPNVKICADSNYYAICKKGENLEVKIHYEIDDKKLVAPMKKGDKVGTIILTDNSLVIGEIDVVLMEDVQKIDYKHSLKKVVENWSL